MQQQSTGNTAMFVVIGVIVIGSLALGMWGLGERKSSAGQGTFTDISAKDAYALIQERGQTEDFVILDIRTPAEFQQAHLKNARNLDFYAQTFKSQLDQLDKQQTYLVYCRSGNRSGKALPLMRQLGFEHVYNMLGGVGHWHAEQLPLTR